MLSVNRKKKNAKSRKNASSNQRRMKGRSVRNRKNWNAKPKNWKNKKSASLKRRLG